MLSLFDGLRVAPIAAFLSLPFVSGKHPGNDVGFDILDGDGTGQAHNRVQPFAHPAALARRSEGRPCIPSTRSTRAPSRLPAS